MTVLLISFLGTLFIGVPIAFSLGLSSIITLLAIDKDIIIVAQKLIAGMDSVPLLAVPGFILAGEIMSKGGIAKRLIILSDAVIGHIRNGLSVVTIVAGMFFSAMNGVAAATTAAIGEIMIPEMKKRGYEPAYVASLAAIVGPLGPIIPPSVIMVIYAIGGNVSVGDLFLAGVIPGIILGACLIIASFFLTRKMKLEIKKRATFSELLHAVKISMWSFITPLIVLGGIYGGVVTPTEASVIAVFYSAFVAKFIHHEFSLVILKECLLNTIKIGGMVMFIVGAASAFSWLVAVTKIATTVSSLILAISTNQIIILLIINIVLLIIGMLMDTVSAIVIFQTVLLPIAMGVHLDPLFFAAVFIVNIAIGNATPPFGYCLFVASKISKQPLEKISINMYPLIGAMLVGLVLINIFPALSTWLPRTLLH